MRYHFFLHYGWFFQNLGKEAVRTFMHTTVLNIYFFIMQTRLKAIFYYHCAQSPSSRPQCCFCLSRCYGLGRALQADGAPY